MSGRKANIASQLRHLGVKRGGVLLVHTSFRAIPVLATWASWHKRFGDYQAFVAAITSMHSRR